MLKRLNNRLNMIRKIFNHPLHQHILTLSHIQWLFICWVDHVGLCMVPMYCDCIVCYNKLLLGNYVLFLCCYRGLNSIKIVLVGTPRCNNNKKMISLTRPTQDTSKCLHGIHNIENLYLKQIFCHVYPAKFQLIKANC